MSDAFGLRLAFDTDDPEFSRGFEAGRIWGLLEIGAVQQGMLVHANNAEMIMRMAEAAGARLKATPISGDADCQWLELHLVDDDLDDPGDETIPDDWDS